MKYRNPSLAPLSSCAPFVWNCSGICLTKITIKPGTESERILFEQLSQFMKKTGRKVSRRQLEENFNYSGDYLYKIIRKYTGLGIYEYSSSLCMTRAAQLLLSSQMNINEIAELLGFCNYTQFYKAFEEYYHMTPKTYRKTMH